MRTIVRKLWQKLGDDAGNPTYVFTAPRVGYRMAKGRNRDWRLREIVAGRRRQSEQI